ncbi:uncharacterized protein [Lolium perenne]|uniref:uncharacterized protein n=1 Tax=Lolium perenne TaxID=4522 RepID=UPI0021EA6168|nr:vegetative cell wall protein gp1-like [Lolium perenne]
MAYRVLEVTLLSAKDLKNVNLITRMEVYAVATISGDPITRQCTPPDPHGGRNPTWNATLRFSVPPTVDATTGGGCLHILLRVQRMFGTDRDVGEVIVPLAEILAGVGDHGGDDLSGPTLPQFASYQIHKVHRTETCGELYLTYRLGPVVATQQQVPLWVRGDELPVVAYPVPEKLMQPLAPPQAFWPGQVAAHPPTKPAGYVAVPLSTAKPTGHVLSPPPTKPAGYVDVPSSTVKPPGHVDVGMPSPKHPGYAAVPSSPKPVGHAAVPPSPKQSGQAVSMPPSLKPSGQAVSIPPSPKQVERVASMPPPQTPTRHVVSTPPSPKPSGQAVSMPPSPKQVKRVVSMPPPQTPARPVVSMPPSPQPAGQAVSMPPSPKQVERAVSIPPPQTPARPVVSMPPSTNPVGRVVSMPPQKPAGQHVSMPPSPKPAGHVTVPSSTSHPSGHAMPSSPKPAGGHVSVPPSPEPTTGHVSFPPSPVLYSGHLSMPPSPKPPVYEAVSPPPKSNGLVAANLPATANNSSNMEFGWGLGAGLVSGAISGMLAGGKSRNDRVFTGSRSVRP